ncbi:MAG: methyl-accepting chemotaxis protein [Gemmatimonadaceae bacterium]
MNEETSEWTVGRRVGSGFAIALFLVVVVTIVAWWALGRTVDSYESAIQQRRGMLIPALQAESQTREATVDYLRFLLEGDKRYSVRADSSIRAARGTAQRAQSGLATDATINKSWEQLVTLLDRWAIGVDSSMSARSAGNQALVLSIRSTTLEPMRSEIDALIKSTVTAVTAKTDSLTDDASSHANAARTSLIVGALLAVILGLISAVLLSRAINRPLQESANVIATSSAEILASTTQQAAGINESMAAVTETVATVDEVAQTAAQAAQRAKALAESAQRAADSGAAGKTAVDRSATAMRAVEAEVDAIAKGIVALAAQASAIGEITASVSDIAEQTRLLALNAAVESARAGEHGRGFAVVAAEIKALANQAKESTSQVSRILSEIQRATSAAVMATEQGTKQTAAATHQVAEAGDIIAKLADVASEASRTAAQIAASAGQQAIGMEQIRQAISNIHDATQQHLTATRQSELAAENLSSLGSRLVRLVGGSRRA